MFKITCISIRYALQPKHFISVAEAVADNRLQNSDSPIAMLIDQQTPWHENVKTIHVPLDDSSDRNRWKILDSVYLN